MHYGQLENSELPSHCKKLHVFFLSTFSQKQGKFCFRKTRSCLISRNNISLNDVDAIAVFLNPALAHILIKVYKNMILPSLLNMICKEYHLTQFQGIIYSTEVSCVTLETYNL